MSVARLALQSFRAGWGERCVIEDLELSVAPGELLMIVGPGGSGKSTLLAAIDGLVNGREPPAGPWWQGEVEVGFELAERMGQHGRADGASPRDLFDPAMFEGRERPWFWPRDPALAAELDGCLDQPFAALPEPRRRLLSFLLTASTDAALLLFDEPDFGQQGPWLDHVHAVFAQLRAARRSMVAVTHYLPLARAMADRVALMLDGRMIEVAPVHEFFHAPKQERTRQFIKWGA